MNFKNNYFIGLTIFVFILFFVGGYYFLNKEKTINFDKKNKKEEIVNIETQKYNKGVEKIDYKTNMSGLTLEKYSTTKSIFFTGGILNVNGETYTGKYLSIFNTEIKKIGDNKFYIDYSIGNSAKNSQNSLSNLGTGTTKNSNEKTKTYELYFLKGFSKMKLLGKNYDYNQNNILDKTNYDLKLYIVKNQAFVIEFENAQENKIRKVLFENYSKKTQEIKQKYWNDPYLANKLVQELNKSYNIQIDKLQ